MIEIGTRVRIDGVVREAAGRLGTVILVTATRDGYLVETDEPFTVSMAILPKTQTKLSRQRRWCAEDELRVVATPSPPREPTATVRGSDPPADLASARLLGRHRLDIDRTAGGIGRGIPIGAPGGDHGPRRTPPPVGGSSPGGAGLPSG